MSTASPSLPQDQQEQPPAGESPSGRLYRGRSVAELIPRIQADLGPQAIVLRRRSGLEGGIGGFFQRPFVEIEARAGAARVDLYDGPAEMPALDSLSALPSDQAPEIARRMPEIAQRTPEIAQRTPEIAQISRTSEQPPKLDPSTFASALQAAGIAISDTRTSDVMAASSPGAVEPAPWSQVLSAYTSAAAATEPAVPVLAAAPAAPTFAATPAPAVPVHEVAPAPTPTAAPAQARSKTQLTVARELIATGIDERFAAELIDAAVAHVLAFNPRIGLRKAVRIELERRIPTATPLPSSGGAVVLAGPGGSGKTRCVASLAGIYRRGAALKASCASLLADGGSEPLKMLLSPALTVPTDACSTRALRALAGARAEGMTLIDTPPLSPADQGQIKALAKLLAAIKPDRVVIALPATLGATAASQLLAALAPLQPDALAITHADETDQIGVAVQAACACGLAPEYLLSGARNGRALERLDPATLAQRLLR